MEMFGGLMISHLTRSLPSLPPSLLFFLHKMVSFIKSQPNTIQKILTHISSSPISDLLLKLISIEDIPEGAGIVEWLYTENLIPSLVQRLNPQLDSEVKNF